MARSHGRVLTDIWMDGDFIALSAGAQRMFLFLLSQPDLEHSGVIPLRERRWSRSCADLTIGQVEVELKELSASRFVVVDEDTEELLVRSLIRHDGAWKQPNVFKAAARSVRAATSPVIKAELLAELRRLDLSEAKHEVRTLRDVLVSELEPFANPSGTPREPQPKGFSENGDEPRGRGSGNGGEVKDSPFPLPPAVRPPAAAVEPRGEITAQTLVAEWIDHVPHKPPGRVIGQASKELKAMLDEGIDPQAVRRGLAEWARSGKHPATLPSFVNEVMNAQPRAVVNGHRSTADERVAATQALKDRFRNVPMIPGEVTP